MLEKSAEILLSLKEYTDSWEEIIGEFYMRIISDDSIYLPLNLKGNDAPKFSMEIETILLVIGMSALKKTGMNRKALEKTESVIVRKVYSSIVGDEPELLDAAEETYHEHFDMFEGLVPKIGRDAGEEERKQGVYNEIIGYARYIISQVTHGPEQNYSTVIQNLGVHLLQAADVLSRLAANTTLDGNSILFRNYRFFVKR